MDAIFQLFWTGVIYVSASGIALLIALSIVLYIITSPYPVVEKYEEEEKYNDKKIRQHSSSLALMIMNQSV